MWTFNSDASDATYAVHFAFMLKENDVVGVEHDYRTEGLFARADWLRLFKEVGFNEAKIIVDLYDREVFAALKPKV